MSVSVIGGADGSTAIFLAGKFNAFMIPAFGVMILFYGIYFIKQLASGDTRDGQDGICFPWNLPV